MPLVVLASTATSPGVTATAVGLSVVWPGPTLLVDANRQPGQAVLAGYLRGLDAGGHGLPGLIRASRENRNFAALIAAETVPLAEGEPIRQFLPGFAHPASAAMFEPLWPQLGQALSQVSRAGTLVVVDAGRCSPEGPPSGLLPYADAVLLLTRTHLPALSALRLYLPGVAESLARVASSTPLAAVIVGPGQPYSTVDIETQFQIPVWGEIPDQPASAAVFSEGAEPSRRFTDSDYLRAVRLLAATIGSRLEARRARIDGAA